MSFETWKQQFYPIPASECEPGRIAITHSLLKWQGLRKENLDAHGLERVGVYSIHDETGPVMRIRGESCSLCQCYYLRESHCDNCPLFAHVRVNCDMGGPFWKFANTGDVESMIAALQGTLEVWDRTHVPESSDPVV